MSIKPKMEGETLDYHGKLYKALPDIVGNLQWTPIELQVKCPEIDPRPTQCRAIQQDGVQCSHTSVDGVTCSISTHRSQFSKIPKVTNYWNSEYNDIFTKMSKIQRDDCFSELTINGLNASEASSEHYNIISTYICPPDFTIGEMSGTDNINHKFSEMKQKQTDMWNECEKMHSLRQKVETAEENLEIKLDTCITEFLSIHEKLNLLSNQNKSWEETKEVYKSINTLKDQSESLAKEEMVLKSQQKSITQLKEDKCNDQLFSSKMKESFEYDQSIDQYLSNAVTRITCEIRGHENEIVKARQKLDFVKKLDSSDKTLERKNSMSSWQM